VGGHTTDVIALPPGELFSEINDNPVAVLLTYGQPVSSWLATPRPRRRNTWPTASMRGLKRSSTFRNYTHSEPRFCALLTEGDVRVNFDRLHRALA
jgi:hypothetical protein